MRRCVSLFLLVAILLLSAPSIYAQGTVSLDHVDGLGEPGQISTGRPVTFYIRLTNSSSFDLLGATNGFRFYSADGGVWSPIIGDTVSIGWGDIFDGGVYFSPAGATGAGADTVGIGGFAILKPGMMSGFSEVVYSITTQVDVTQNGKTFCLDSSYYPPAGYWFWSHSTNGNTIPSWDGPHCFVATGCCVGDRGNVDGDTTDAIDISDLVYLVDYMFSSGPEPPCFDEADINGDGAPDIDISDLVYLVDYMFNSGPAPPSCF